MIHLLCLQSHSRHEAKRLFRKKQSVISPQSKPANLLPDNVSVVFCLTSFICQLICYKLINWIIDYFKSTINIQVEEYAEGTMLPPEVQRGTCRKPPRMLVCTLPRPRKEQRAYTHALRNIRGLHISRIRHVDLSNHRTSREWLWLF